MSLNGCTHCFLKGCRVGVGPSHPSDTFFGSQRPHFLKDIRKNPSKGKNKGKTQCMTPTVSIVIFADVTPNGAMHQALLGTNKSFCRLLIKPLKSKAIINFVSFLHRAKNLSDVPRRPTIPSEVNYLNTTELKLLNSLSFHEHWIIEKTSSEKNESFCRLSSGTHLSFFENVDKNDITAASIQLDNFLEKTVQFDGQRGNECKRKTFTQCENLAISAELFSFCFWVGLQLFSLHFFRDNQSPGRECLVVLQNKWTFFKNVLEHRRARNNLNQEHEYFFQLSKVLQPN